MLIFIGLVLGKIGNLRMRLMRTQKGPQKRSRALLEGACAFQVNFQEAEMLGFHSGNIIRLYPRTQEKQISNKNDQSSWKFDNIKIPTNGQIAEWLELNTELPT